MQLIFNCNVSFNKNQRFVIIPGNYRKIPQIRKLKNTKTYIKKFWFVQNNNFPIHNISDILKNILTEFQDFPIKFRGNIGK